MSKYNKTYMECLEIAAARLGTPELAIDIQFAHEDKHYELMQTAAELYLYLSDLHKNSVMQAEGSASAEGAAVGQRSVDTGVRVRNKSGDENCEDCTYPNCFCGG
jgi:hypothetical protein